MGPQDVNHAVKCVCNSTANTNLLSEVRIDVENMVQLSTSLDYTRPVMLCLEHTTVLENCFMAASVSALFCFCLLKFGQLAYYSNYFLFLI